MENYYLLSYNSDELSKEENEILNEYLPLFIYHILGCASIKSYINGSYIFSTISHFESLLTHIEDNFNRFSQITLSFLQIKIDYYDNISYKALGNNNYEKTFDSRYEKISKKKAYFIELASRINTFFNKSNKSPK